MKKLKITDAAVKRHYGKKSEEVIDDIYNTFASSGLRYTCCSKPWDLYDGLELITSLKNCKLYMQQLVSKYPKLEKSFKII